MPKVPDIEELFEELENSELDPESDFTWGNVKEDYYEYIDEDAGINDHD